MEDVPATAHRIGVQSVDSSLPVVYGPSGMVYIICLLSFCTFGLSAFSRLHRVCCRPTEWKACQKERKKYRMPRTRVVAEQMMPFNNWSGDSTAAGASAAGLPGMKLPAFAALLKAQVLWYQKSALLWRATVPSVKCDVFPVAFSKT